jgi:hypothetical protein
MVRRPDSDSSVAEIEFEVINTIAQVEPAEPSDITDGELEECVAASAIALCWHLASIGNGERRR